MNITTTDFYRVFMFVDVPPCIYTVVEINLTPFVDVGDSDAVPYFVDVTSGDSLLDTFVDDELPSVARTVSASQSSVPSTSLFTSTNTLNQPSSMPSLSREPSSGPSPLPSTSAAATITGNVNEDLGDVNLSGVVITFCCRCWKLRCGYTDRHQWRLYFRKSPSQGLHGCLPPASISLHFATSHYSTCTSSLAMASDKSGNVL